LELVGCYSVVLTQIFFSEQRLKIREMEATFLMPWFREIKNRARHNVIYVPNIAVVLSCHSRLKLGFKVNPEILNRATQKNNRTGSF